MGPDVEKYGDAESKQEASRSLPRDLGKDGCSIFAGDYEHEKTKWFSEVAFITALCDLFQDAESDSERDNVVSQIYETSMAFGMAYNQKIKGRRSRSAYSDLLGAGYK